jgi:hypothetical protein
MKRNNIASITASLIGRAVILVITYLKTFKTAVIVLIDIFAKPQVFYYLVSDAKIFDIIYQLSPLLECDPTVCLPEKNKVKSKVTRGQAAFG